MVASVAAVVTLVVVVTGYFQASLPSRKGYHVPYCHLSRLSLVWSVCAVLSCFSCVQLCDPMNCSLPGYSVHRREYWSVFPCLPPGNIPDPGIKPCLRHLLHWQEGSLPLAPPGKPQVLPGLPDYVGKSRLVVWDGPGANWKDQLQELSLVLRLSIWKRGPSNMTSQNHGKTIE